MTDAERMRELVRTTEKKQAQDRLEEHAQYVKKIIKKRLHHWRAKEKQNIK